MDTRSVFWLAALLAWVVIVVVRRRALISKAGEFGRMISLAWYGAPWIPIGITLFVVGINSLWVLAFFVWPLGFLLGLYNLWPGLYWFSGYEPEYWIPLVVAFALGLTVVWIIGGSLGRTAAGKKHDRSMLLVLSFFAVYGTLFALSWGVYFVGLRSGIGHIFE